MTTMARPNFRVVIAMMGIALALSTWLTLKPQNDDLPVAELSAIPGDRDNWRCVQEVPLDSALMTEMKSDSYMDRLYQDRNTGQNVEIMAVYRRYGRREFAHRPDQCYPAAGFNITSKDHTTLPYAGRDVDAIHLVADGRNVQLANGKVGVPNEVLTYFFASGDRTESDFIRQQLAMAFERLIPEKNGWTFIRLNSRIVTNEDDALNAQKDFMRVYGGAIRQVITTDGSAPAVTAALSPDQATGTAP